MPDEKTPPESAPASAQFDYAQIREHALLVGRTTEAPLEKRQRAIVNLVVTLADHGAVLTKASGAVVRRLTEKVAALEAEVAALKSGASPAASDAQVSPVAAALSPEQQAAAEMAALPKSMRKNQTVTKAGNGAPSVPPAGNAASIAASLAGVNLPLAQIK